MLRLGAVDGWVVTQDGETIKTGFANDFDAVKWMHQRHSFSVDHAVQHEGYDIVLVENGKVTYSYKQAARDQKRKLGGLQTRSRHPVPVWPEFVDAYLQAAIWASSTSDDVPLDVNYTVEDFTQDAIDQAVEESNNFVRANRQDLRAASKNRSQHGHDFFLTRNLHGAGFMDHDYGPIGERLAEAARRFGRANAYADRDGKLRFE